MNITIRESEPTGEQFIQLVKTTGWQGIIEKGPERLEQAVSSSWYALSAYDGDQLVGMGRILSDGVLQALICDLIVLPDYQNQGIGSAILKKLLAKCRKDEILMVQLFSARDKSDYYKMFGFEERPADAPGMRWMIRTLIETE